MYDKVLLAVDHSEISDRALLAARDLALLSKGEVWVLRLREREIAVKTQSRWPTTMRPMTRTRARHDI